jgi:hypothetical protein
MAPRYLSIADLRRELQKREGLLAKLVAKRDKLAGKLAGLSRKIAALGGEAPVRLGRPPGRKASPARVGRPGKRARGKVLVDYLKDIMGASKSGMRVLDAVDAVAKAGYRSASKDFYGIVATTLRDNKLFRRVARGIYKLKG